MAQSVISLYKYIDCCDEYNTVQNTIQHRPLPHRYYRDLTAQRFFYQQLQQPHNTAHISSNGRIAHNFWQLLIQ